VAVRCRFFSSVAVLPLPKLAHRKQQKTAGGSAFGGVFTDLFGAAAKGAILETTI